MDWSEKSFEPLANSRLFERFSVSVESKIQIDSSTKTYDAIIKNITFTGMLAICKADLPLYQEFKFMFDGGKVNLIAVILRKEKDAHHYAYGIKIIYKDAETINKISNYLFKLAREQKAYRNTKTNPQNKILHLHPQRLPVRNKKESIPEFHEVHSFTCKALRAAAVL